MRLIRTFASLAAPRNRVDILPDDDADNRIPECALEARAHIIVTGDKRLQRLGQVQGLRLLSPREFLDAYAASAGSPWTRPSIGRLGQSTRSDPGQHVNMPRST